LPYILSKGIKLSHPQKKKDLIRIIHGFEFSTPTTTHVCACAAASVQADKPNLASSPPVGYQQHIGRKAVRQVVVTTRALASGGESKNILIMGGTRFIGLFLARQLVAAGHQVCCISAMCIPQCPNYLSLHYFTLALPA
jgi:hypothetical protein